MAARKRAGLSLDQILNALRESLPELRRRYKVCALGVFGSYVRGEQRKRSDVDVLVEFELQGRPNLFDVIHMEDELGDLLGVKVDLVEKGDLKPYIGRRVLAEVIWLDGGGQAGANQRQDTASSLRGGGSMRRDYMDFLQDIADAIDQVARFVRGLTYETLIEDEMRVLAITKAVENMGEAAKRIRDDVTRRYPDIPWREMAGTRDRVAHGYFDVNLPILWSIAIEFLPPLGPVIQHAIEAELRSRGEDEEDRQ